MEPFIFVHLPCISGFGRPYSVRNAVSALCFFYVCRVLRCENRFSHNRLICVHLASVRVFLTFLQFLPVTFMVHRSLSPQHFWEDGLGS